MGFLSKLGHTPAIKTKRDPSVLEGYNIAWTPHVLTTDTQRHLDPILKYADAKEALLACETTEDALSIVMAYIAPKVAEKGALGDPTRGLDTLDVEVPERRDEIQIVRRFFGLHRAHGTHKYGNSVGLGGGGAAF